MADLARLRIAVDSRDARTAATDLRALGSAASSAEAPAARLNSVFTKTNAVLAALGIALGQALKAARDFEKSMAEVATLIDTSVVSMDQLTASAREQAKAFGGDVQTQAKALYQIISAGATTAAQANSTLTAANKLAVGGVTDVATAADGLTSVMNAYGSSVGSAADVSDAMFVAMRAGKTTIAELSASVGGVAPLAAQMGVSFDELTAATAALTKGGVSTSVAMTGLRAILAAVAKPSDEAGKLAKQLGIQFDTAAIQSKGLAGFMEELRVKTGGSQDAMAKLFGGVEALVPALALTGAAGEDLNAILDQMGVKAGATDDAVSKMSETFDFQFNVAVANVNDLLLQLGLVLQATVLPVLRAFNDNLGTITTVLGGLAAATATYIGLQAVASAGTTFLASQFALQAAAAISSAAAIGGLASAKMLLATAATTAGGAVKALTLALVTNPFTAAAVAVGVLVAAMISLGTEQRKARQETDNLINSLVGLARARDADFKSQRALLAGQLAIEKGRDPNAGFLGRMTPQWMQDALVSDQQNKIARLTRTLNEADQAYEEAEKAAEQAAKAAEQAAKGADKNAIALDKLGKSAKSAAKELSEAEKQKKRLTEQTDDFIKSLTREIEEIGKAEKEMRQLSIARALEIAQTEDQKKKILELAAVREKALNAEKQKELTKEIEKLNREVEQEIRLLGLTGDAREQAILAYELETIAADFLARGIEGGNEALEKYLRLRGKLASSKKVFDREAADTQRLANNLEAAAGMLGPNGIGAIAQGLLKLQVELDDGSVKTMSQILSSELENVFEGAGDLISKALVGAQFGGLAARVTGGSQLGGQIGGGIASAVGGDALGGLLGKFSKLGGPIAGIAGGIIGSLIGGMFAKTPQASATVSIAGGNALMAGVTGSKKLQGVATGLANGLIKGLGDVAGALGGELGGAVRLSIGQRKDKFTVDLSGRGRTKGVPTFATEAEAIAFAMRNAIAQGAITGVSAGAQALIRASGDLNEQVQKALDFDNVAKDLMREINPLQAELDDLGREFDRLSRIFDEAGAGVAERAQLEELFSIRRQKAIFERERPAREKEIELLELQGRSVEALALSRRLELEAMDESLRAIQQRIFAQQDLNSANEAVAAAEGRVAEARRAQRQREVEGLRSQLDGLDAIIAGREAAQQALRQAYDAEIARIRGEIGQREANIASLESAFDEQASVFEGTINQFRSFADSLRDFRSTIIPLNGTGRESLAMLQKRFAQVAALAAGGDTAAMGQFTQVGGALRDAIIANAPDRVTMTRQLLALQAQTDAVIDGAEGQATIAEQQLEAARAQTDRLIAVEQAAIAQLEAQIEATTALVGQFIELNAQTLSVNDAINTLLTAEQAAIAAEAQKASLLAQIDALLAVDENVIGLEDAERELAEAQARRDELLMEINRNGFANVVAATGQLAAATNAAVRAAERASRAPAASILPNRGNVIPFPSIMGGSSGGGRADLDSILNQSISMFANGGMHSGGLRIVGENGPELEATGPSRIYNANQLGGMMSGGETADEIKALRAELKNAMYQIAKNTGKSYDLLDRWNGDGLPPERIVA